MLLVYAIEILAAADAAELAAAADAAPARVQLSEEARATWRACVLARFHERPTECDLCKPPSDCLRCYFCVPCKEGGLCDNKFNEGAPHHNHDRLHVYKIDGQLSVRKAHLPSILAGTTEEVAEFATMSNLYFLRTRPPALSGPRIWCVGCEEFVLNSENDALKRQNEEAARLCSIECLVKYCHSQHTFRHRRKQPHPDSSPLM